MRIGELARAAGVSTQAVRFYERSGLLDPPNRGSNGYRHYEGDAVDRLRFVRAAQASGLTLAEIRPIIGLRDEGQPPCRHTVEVLQNKLDDLRRQREQLEALERDIEGLIVRSEALDPEDCRDNDICHVIPARMATSPDGQADRASARVRT